MAVRTFDLFCGGGGSSRGALMAGAAPVAALDMWELAAETYRRNFPDATVYRTQAEAMSPHRVAEEVGRIDLLLASPECTSHSVARGNTPVCEKSRNTAFQVVRFAKVLRPRWIVVENVIQFPRWDRFEEWHRKLKRIGYRTAWGVLDARYFSTPQARRRFFLVADLECDPCLPERTTPTKKTVKSSVIGKGQTKQKPWRFSPVNEGGLARSTLTRFRRGIEALGEAADFLIVYYGSDGAGGFQRTDRCLRTVTTVDRFAYVRPNCRGHELRMLQPPELAAAMGFTRDHAWPKGNRRERIKLIGNAVCPRVMREVVETLTGTASWRAR